MRKPRTRALHGFTVPVRGLRLHVLVYRNVPDMRRAAREVDGRFAAHKTFAWSKSYALRHRRTNRLHPEFAAIGFAQTFLPPRFVVHEAVHAACRWMARKGFGEVRLPVVSRERGHDFWPEETLAEVTDEICRAVFKKFYALGVWK